MDKEIDLVTIDGVMLNPLRQYVDVRGAVFHVFRNDVIKISVEEVYISKVNFGVIKGWKKHSVMTQRFVVPFGRMEIVIYDDRMHSNTFGVINRIELNSEDLYNQLVIPPGVWYAFRALSGEYSLLLNVADLIHDPHESEQIPVDTDKIVYDWNKI